MTISIAAPVRRGTSRSRWVVRHALPAFFVLAFSISWAAWLPLAAASRGLLAQGPDPTLAGLLGAFGPTLAAGIVVAAAGGWGQVRALLGRLLPWRVAPWWYAFALCWPAIHSLATTGVHVALGGAAPDFAAPPVLRLYPAPAEAFAAGPWPLLPFVFLQNLMLGSAMGEEPGWRGFALPRLQRSLGALRASLLVGLLWGVWHLPRFLDLSQPLSAAPFGWFLLAILGDSVLYTWLFNRTRGSLLPVLLLHAATATTELFLTPADASPWVAPALTWVVAGTSLWRGGWSGHLGWRRLESAIFARRRPAQRVGRGAGG